MNDGKLVRDLIPDVIQKSGRNPEVRYLKGEELLAALCSKLCEEAAEVAGAVNEREKLIEELADVTEVVTALMALRGISESDVAAIATAKAHQRGRFDHGTWLVSAVPAQVRRYCSTDVDAQRVHWIPERWTDAFAGHEAAHADLSAHSQEAGGIARSFIHARSNGDPVALFLMAMVWGYRPKDYGPHRTKAVLAQEGAADNIATIVDATRTEGAAAGWRALLRTHKIKGLNMSFGTKLLYFAGYTTSHRPRPLILDERVRSAIQNVSPGIVPARGWVREADYIRYLDLAEEWAVDPLWQQNPDTVEYALFASGP
ncbi:nucleoside triphosphate pyrophosphohydrolase [Mycolicibacterium holsaticum]|uniref:Uncharacterized protein n=1 Tax=Mycolicibacterium holsaticum TaxID=152142 RepID=A0A1E3RX88_9MYCO|nr:nucleoside triphosphate pyrophosphohydrolase [Mycolicibacterium holsaticum]ODQ94441.1 hypothetical protein BHQ17_08945 [Mycolicibacterium holsaticum]